MTHKALEFIQNLKNGYLAAKEVEKGFYKGKNGEILCSLISLWRQKWKNYFFYFQLIIVEAR